VVALGVLLLFVPCPEEESAQTSGALQTAVMPDVPAPSTETHHSPPKIVSVHVVPPGSVPDDQLRADVMAEDPDGDSISYDFVWLRNGEYIVGASQETLEYSILH
jgi:hypothetical protein